MKVCIIGNYPKDEQESMQRFGRWLGDTVVEAGGTSEELHPDVVFGKHFTNMRAGLGKWIGYIDKFVLYPRKLRKHSRDPRNKDCIYHIVDHSNAYYARFLPRDRSLITCHDVLAIRGGLGDRQAHVAMSPTGMILQKWILRNLKRAPRIIFVSDSTRQDYDQLKQTGCPTHPDQLTQVIHNGLNAPFVPMDRDQAMALLDSFGEVATHPYFFHIGSSLGRKNRMNIIRAFAKFHADHPGYRFVFAGAQFGMDESGLIDELGIGSAVFHAGRVSHEELNAFYSQATALVFPSYSEGFGWPVIEAHACECPVITSNRTSLPEISGGAARIVDPDSIDALADAMDAIKEPDERARLIALGKTNILRFDPKKTQLAYIDVYRKLTADSSG